MKIVFSTKNVSRATFLDTCRYAFDYGFEGFEIYDAINERKKHYDSILRRERIADAKRKLVNRNLAVSALRMSESIDRENTTAELIEKYVDMAAASGVSNVIVRISEKIDFAVLDAQLAKSYCGKGDYADIAIVDGLSSDVEYYAIGFEKGSELTSKVNAELEKLAADGTIAALGEKYGVATTVITDFSDQK